MKTLNEILDNYKDYAVVLDDRFGFQISKVFKQKSSQKKQASSTMVMSLIQSLRNGLERISQSNLSLIVEFGFEKALDQRGISASLMFYVVLRWNQVLEEGLENYPEENYAMYGLPLFKATAVKYGWENPIGDDNGDEEFYNEQRYEGIFYT